MLVLFLVRKLNGLLFGEELFLWFTCVSITNIYHFVCVPLSLLVFRAGCGV